MNVDDIHPDFKNAKYILLSLHDGVQASDIKDNDELQKYLTDGSVDEGDLLVTVAKINVIKIKRVGEMK
jgi:hypothetical protein